MTKRTPDTATQPQSLENADRREVMTGALGGAIAALLGASATPAGATSGIGFFGQAQAQDAGTPIGAKW